MADRTNIQWADASNNWARGCHRVSRGCDNCYAIHDASRYPWGHGLTIIRNGKPDWSGDVTVIPEKMVEPLRWRKPRRIFVNSGSDTFHHNIPTHMLDTYFGIMAICERHDFILVTKRPARASDFFEKASKPDHLRYCINRASVFAGQRRLKGNEQFSPTMWPRPNVWLLASAEDQKAFDERMRDLDHENVGLIGVSAEPLLGPIDMSEHIHRIGWVIVGGESGHEARPCEVQWIRSIVVQCRRAGVPCFVKQFGSKATGMLGRPLVFDHSKGGEPAEWPAGDWPREWPGDLEAA